MALDIQEITNPFQIQEEAENAKDVERLKKLELLVIQGGIGNSEQRMTLLQFIKGRIKKLSGK